MKRTIAIVAGGDTSEFYVSLRSAQGVYSFIDKEKYDLYIVEMEGLRWEVQLPDGLKTPVDRNDFSFMNSWHSGRRWSSSRLSRYVAHSLFLLRSAGGCHDL